jgi:hypothetical protein
MLLTKREQIQDSNSWLSVRAECIFSLRPYYGSQPQCFFNAFCKAVPTLSAIEHLKRAVQTRAFTILCSSSFEQLVLKENAGGRYINLQTRA